MLCSSNMASHMKHNMYNNNAKSWAWGIEEYDLLLSNHQHYLSDVPSVVYSSVKHSMSHYYINKVLIAVELQNRLVACQV